jgi:hypothetical protein
LCKYLPSFEPDALVLYPLKAIHAQENYFFDGVKDELRKAENLRIRFYDGDQKAVITVKVRSVFDHRDAVHRTPQVPCTHVAQTGAVFHVILACCHELKGTGCCSERLRRPEGLHAEVSMANPCTGMYVEVAVFARSLLTC